MNTLYTRHNLLGLASFALVAALGNSSTFAQTLENTSEQQLPQPTVTTESVEEIDIQLDNQSQNIFTLTSESSTPVITPESQTSNSPNLQNQSTTESDTTDKVVTPIPGTAVISSTPLISPDFSNSTNSPTNTQTSNTKVAQNLLPGRATRGGKSYIGIGANIGISGDDSSLGDGNFAVLSKIGLTRNISIRPSAVIGDNTVILIPATYDLSIKDAADPFTEVLPFTPYVGAGVAIKTGDDSEVGLLLSGGVDFPLGSQFTATASVNAGFFDDVDIGLLLGVGYNFPGF